MKRVFRKLFVFVLFILYSPNLLGHGTIIIQNVEHDNGYIDLKIYTDKKSFLKEELAVESVRKMNKGEVGVFISMGGNFLSAMSDTKATAEGLQK